MKAREMNFFYSGLIQLANPTRSILCNHIRITPLHTASGAVEMGISLRVLKLVCFEDCSSTHSDSLMVIGNFGLPVPVI
jgi:hypothetical protein